jgi:hypothetical protein
MSLGSITDKTLIVGGASSPWWLDHVNTIGGVTIVVTGSLIGLIRLWIAIRDLRNGRKS